MARVIAICGALGSLVMSAVNRSLGAKDWGTGIAGHGGYVDRLDSLGFAAQSFFISFVGFGRYEDRDTLKPTRANGLKLKIDTAWRLSPRWPSVF